MAKHLPQRDALIAFDRDGVINDPVGGAAGPRPPWTLEEVTLVTGASEAVQAAAESGYRIAVVTNQPDVARGAVELATVHEINRTIRSAIPSIEKFYVCPHDNDDYCSCRKPKPGMLLAAASHLVAKPAVSWMIGDRWTDVAAGRAAGFRTVLISDEESMRPTSIGGPPANLTADLTVVSITEAVAAILRYDSGWLKPARCSSTSRRDSGVPTSQNLFRTRYAPS